MEEEWDHKQYFGCDEYDTIDIGGQNQEILDSQLIITYYSS